jgi:hypothetical protein
VNGTKRYDFAKLAANRTGKLTVPATFDHASGYILTFNFYIFTFIPIQFHLLIAKRFAQNSASTRQLFNPVFFI